MKVLDLLLLSKDYITEEEGFVLQFEDGLQAKCKHTKYLELHGLIGPDAFRENLLVQSIISGSIDDVISALVTGPKKDMIVQMEEKVSKEFNALVNRFILLRDFYFNKYNENRKEFAIKHSKTPMFGSVMKSLRVEDDIEDFAEKAVKEHILKVTNSLGKAKEWVNSLEGL